MRHFPAGAARQRGAFAILATLLLLMVVAVAIRYLLSASQTTTYATTIDSQNIQALMLAESGLERARGMLLAAGQSGLTDASCTGIGAGGPFSLGGGTFTYTGLTSVPASCTGSGCQNCIVTVQGNVGSASRTVTGVGAYKLGHGVTGVDYRFEMKLRTIFDNTLILANIAYIVPGGNGGVAPCPTVMNCFPSGSIPPIPWNDSAGGGQTAGNGAGLEWSISGLGQSGNVGAILIDNKGKYGNGSTTVDGATASVDTRQEFSMVAVQLEGKPSLTMQPIGLGLASNAGYTSGTPQTIDFTVQPNGFCTSPANTLLVGISGTLKDPDTAAAITSVAVSKKVGAVTTTSPAFTRLAHLNSSLGNLFSEVWALYDDTSGVDQWSCSTNKCNNLNLAWTSTSTQVKWVIGVQCVSNVNKLPQELTNFLVGQTSWWEPF